MSELGHIYIIKNNINSKTYVGQTVLQRKKGKFGYLERFKEHIASAKRNPTYHFDRMIKELGTENFYVELLEECEKSKLDEREEYYIEKTKSLHPNGYNIVIGNPNKNTNPEHVSVQLKKYYNNETIRKKHSDVHKNIFNEINKKGLTRIEIKPIKENGENKLIYVYFRYENDFIRRRYGGKHISFENNLDRCLEDINQQFANIKVLNYVENKNILDQEHVYNDSKLLITTFSFKDKNTIALYCTINAKRTRKVFGGKTTTYNDAFNKCLEFIKINWKNTPKISLSESLKATLPNCGKLLEDLSTTQ